MVHQYSSMDTTVALKKLPFILSVKSDFHMTDNLSIAVHAFASRVLMSFSVDETLLAYIYIYIYIYIYMNDRIWHYITYKGICHKTY